jgi:hypothetical protein
VTDRRSPAPKHDLGSSPAAEEWSRAGIPARVEELAPLRRQVQVWANSTVTVTVTDAGRWKTPSAQGIAGGRGLPLMRGLADYQEVHSTADGTRVTLRWNCA